MQESIRTATVRDAVIAKQAPTVYGAPSTRSSAAGSTPAGDHFGDRYSHRNLTAEKEA